MSETKTYTGGCHCGRVKFEVTAAFDAGMACNCSICSRRGWLLAFVPAAQMKLLSAPDAVTDYQFGKKHLHHTFCPTCGVASYSTGSRPDGSATYAINLRCVEGLDVESLPVKHFDGRSR